MSKSMVYQCFRRLFWLSWQQRLPSTITIEVFCSTSSYKNRKLVDCASLGADAIFFLWNLLIDMILWISSREAVDDVI